MTIQTKGWLSKRCTQQKILMTWMSFLIVNLWISLLSGVVSQNYKTLPKHWWWLFQYKGVSRCTVWQWVKQGKPIKSIDGDFSNTRMFLKCTFWQVESSKLQKFFQSTDGDFSSTRVFPGAPSDKWIKHCQGKPIKSNDGDFSSTRVFPGISFDSESIKESKRAEWNESQ